MTKTTLKIISVSLVAVMLCFALASCSNAPRGSYGNEKFTLTFSGDKVELVYGSGDKKTTVEGTFEMGEDEEGNPTINITLPEPSSFLDLEYATYRGIIGGEKSYNAGSDNTGDYIEIGGTKLYKK